METLLVTIIGVITTVWLGGIQYKANQIDAYQKNLITHDELQDLVAGRLEAYNVKLDGLKEDIQHINETLDALIEKENRLSIQKVLIK